MCTENRSPVRLELSTSEGGEPRAAECQENTPFSIALLGDFSGRANRGLDASLADRRPIQVDRDNFDQVFGSLGVELHSLLNSGNDSHLRISFAALDYFHPDHLYECLPVFQVLREMREQMETPGALAELARQTRGPADIATEKSVRPAPGPAPSATPGSLLDQVLEESESLTASGIGGRTDDFQEFVRRIVEPYAVAGVDPRQAELLAQIDGAVAEAMRSLLHHPDFQALEAAWRAVFLLVCGLETGPRLKLYLVDVSRQELAADFDAHPEPEQTATYKLLVESSVGTPGGEPWALLVGNYTFGPEPQDLALLKGLAEIARAAGAPWLARADSRLAGCESIAATPDPDSWKREPEPGWAAFRRLPEARYIGLALPRFLLRLPYGSETDPCEQIAFEEMADRPDHEQYLWGNPAFACALLLAQSFTTHGWKFRPGTHLNLQGLPLHTYREAGETIVKPCAEALLTERAAGRILERGLMPLASLKDQDEARLVQFQSVADPSQALAGRWETR